MDCSKVRRLVSGTADHLLALSSWCRATGRRQPSRCSKWTILLIVIVPPKTGSDVKGIREGGQLWEDTGVA